VAWQVQGKDPSLDYTQDIPDEDEDDELCPASATNDEETDADGSTVSSTTGGVSKGLALPPCELARLSEIAELFATTLSSSPIRRDRLAAAVEHADYIRRLVDLFHCCADLDDVDGLHQLYAVFRSLFMLNKTSLLEKLLSADMIMDVIGALEYDPVLPEPAAHREFLTTGSRLRQVIAQLCYLYFVGCWLELKPNSITLSGSKLVADRFEAGRGPVGDELRTCFEPVYDQV